MKKDKKLHMQLKTSFKGVFAFLSPFSKRNFFTACIWLLFASNGFTQEGLNSASENASSSFLCTEEKRISSSKEIATHRTSVSIVQEDLNFSKKTFNEEKSELLASSLSDSLSDNNLGLSVADSESVGAFSQVTQAQNGFSDVSESSNATEENIESVENTLSLETYGNDNATNRIQQLIDEDLRKREKENSTTEKEGYQNTSAEKNDQAINKPASKPIHLFNTVDFLRTPVEGHAPKWERVLNSEKKKNLFLVLVLKKECPLTYISAGLLYEKK